MRVGVISRDPDRFATRRLLESARRRGHEAHWIPVLETALLFGRRRADSRSGPEGSVSRGPTILCRGEPCPRLDGVLPRVGTYQAKLALSLLRAFEGRGVAALPDSRALVAARDKGTTLQRLAEAGVAVPESVVLKDLERVEWAIAAVGGPPVVVKPRIGAQGRSVVLSDTLGGAISTIEAFLRLDRDLVVQRFVAEARASDLRLFVVGDRVVAAVRRRARPGHFAANHHQGGALARHEPSAEEVALALRAARLLGLGVAGVDLIESDDGPLVLEANGSPGLEGIERVTGLGLAELIVEELEAVRASAESAAGGGRAAPATARRVAPDSLRGGATTGLA